jgi:hypothetical protein
VPESEVARVTSKKSESVRSSRNAPDTFDWKSFHRRQKFSEVPIFSEDKASLKVKTLAALDELLAEMGVKGIPASVKKRFTDLPKKSRKMSHFKKRLKENY